MVKGYSQQEMKKWIEFNLCVFISATRECWEVRTFSTDQQYFKSGTGPCFLTLLKWKKLLLVDCMLCSWLCPKHDWLGFARPIVAGLLKSTGSFSGPSGKWIINTKAGLHHPV